MIVWYNSFMFSKKTILFSLFLMFCAAAAAKSVLYVNNSYGLTVNFPETWQLNQRRGVLIEAVPGDGTTGIAFNIIARKVPELNSLKKTEITDPLTLIDPEALFDTGNASVLYTGKGTINGRAALIFRLGAQVQQQGITVALRTYHAAVSYEDTMFVFSCIAAQLSEQDAVNLMLSYAPLFEYTLDNVKFSSTAPILPLSQGTRIIIFFAIGLGFPLLIRFILTKKPMQKNPAILAALACWIINIIFLSLTTEGKPHLLLLLLALYSFFIFTKEAGD